MSQNLTTSNLLTSQRFVFLDALRGIAALYVVIFHLYSIIKQKSGYAFADPLDAILQEGTLGVQIFFVLSGFVIAYSIYRQNITWGFIGRFCLRRSVRLDPPYWMALILTLIISLISVIFFTKPVQALPTGYEFAANLFYLQDFFQMERIIHVSWTLCLEIQLYLFFVIFLGFLFWIQAICQWTLKEKIFDTVIFLSAFGCLFIFSLVQNLNLPFQSTIPGLFTPYWYQFFMGCILCWVHVKALSVRYFWICCSLMILVLLFSPLKTMFETLAIAFMIYAVGSRNRLQDLLTFQPFQYLGKISYSLYLTHWLFAGKLVDVLARRFIHDMNVGIALTILCVGLGLALITARFFYQWIEAPSLQWSQFLRHDRSAKAI